LRAVTQVAIWAREVKPSLVRMCSTWVSAVRCAMTRVLAVSLLDDPAATSSATCCSSGQRGRRRLAGVGRGRRGFFQGVGDHRLDVEPGALLHGRLELVLTERGAASGHAFRVV